MKISTKTRFMIIFAAIAITVFGCSTPENSNKNGTGTNNANTPAGNSVSNTSAANAGPVTACDDDQITENLRKIYANPPFAADSRYFNFFSRGCIVTLYGGVQGESLRSQAIMEADSQKKYGVIKVDKDKFFPNITVTSQPIPGSCACPDGYKPCGDICIPNGDPCNIKGETCKKKTDKPTSNNKAP